MPTIHEDIEPWLAASVHDQLSPNERTQLQEHLATCATCRALHDQEFAMNTMIQSTLEESKPDLAFEQRVLTSFRHQIPAQRRLVSTVASFFRARSTRIVSLAIALLLTGNWLTSQRWSFLGNEEMVAAAMRNQEKGSSLGGLRGRLGWEEQRAEMARGGSSLRELASSAGQTASPRKKAGGDQSGIVAQDAPQDTDRVVVTGSRTPPKEAETALPVTTYSANALGKASEPPVAPASKIMAAPAGVAENRAGGFRQESDKKDLTGQGSEPGAAVPANPPDANRKLVRNAQVEIEVIKFEDAVAKITTFATDARGYVATSSSEKQANGKLRGEVVVKVVPDKLDAFLGQLRSLGEVKNQTLGTEDATKQYFDIDSRLKNARVMEQRLLEILKTKSNKVADLLEVERELGRVRAQIEQMQGELKYMDAQVAFATVTITLSEKDMDVPAAFLLQRRAQLALFSTAVEKTFAEVKSVIDGAKAQISSSTLERDSAGEATARLVLLIAPEDADTLIARIKGMGRVQNYNEQTDRIAQGGNGMAENARVKRDKVQLSIVISRNEQEPALQTTSLSILTSSVAEKAAQLKQNAAKAGAEIRNSSFNRQPNGQEFANLTLRVPMKDYPALMSSFGQLGKVKDVSVQRDDRRGAIDEATAPADINIRIYSQADIVGDEGGLFATVRRTLGQGAAALMWSLRMIGVALAFFAPWVLAIAAVIWIVRRIARVRKARKDSAG